MKNDSNMQLTATSSQFTASKLHPNKLWLLFKSVGESKIAAISIEDYLKSAQVPQLGAVVDIPLFEDFIFDFCHEFPCYFNPMKATLTAFMLTSKGVKEKDLFIG